MGGPFRKIAVVQGMPSAQVQELFRTLVDRWQPSTRLAGVIAEDHGLADRACSAGFLRSLGNGERFPIFQDLGPGSKTCHLAGAGALAAAGGGLRDAFGAAMEAGVPVLTSVSSGFAAAWQSFAAPLFVVVPADADMIDAWWNAVRLPAPAMTGAAS